MDPILTGGIISAGSGIVSDIANLFGQSKANKQSQAFQVGMYNRQRADALADFNMQNAYNSPQQQMARLKAAGLNPNLVYGHGADAGMAAPVRSSSPGSYQAKFPELRGLSGIGDVAMQAVQQHMQAKQLQLNAGAVAADISNKSAQAAKALSEIDLNKIKGSAAEFKLSFDQLMANARLTGADLNNQLTYENINKTRASTAYLLDENERRDALTAQNLQTAAVNILVRKQDIAKSKSEQDEIAQRIQNLKSDKAIKDYEISLNKKGITKGDPGWFRVLEMVMRGENANAIKQVIDGMTNKTPITSETENKMQKFLQNRKR